jgi:hypothetical protein
MFSFCLYFMNDLQLLIIAEQKRAEEEEKRNFTVIFESSLLLRYNRNENYLDVVLLCRIS